jgi:hypothetical protein
MVEQQSCSLPFKRRSLTAETPPLFFNCNPERERGLRPERERGLRPSKGRSLRPSKGRGLRPERERGLRQQREGFQPSGCAF